MGTRNIEIGVFNRVSSQQALIAQSSSGSRLSARGVTSVTAVSTRIGVHPLPQVGIEFADNPPEIVSFSELSRDGTRQGNPNNAKHVTKIHRKLPSSRSARETVVADALEALGQHV